VTITVVLAEDQLMVLGALGTLLGLEPDIDVIGTAPDGDEALRLVRNLQPDVLLTDIEMPGHTGLDLAGELKRAGLPTRVVILTTFARAVTCGALWRPAPSATCSRTHRRRPWPRQSAPCTPAVAPSTPNSPPMPGARPTHSPTGNARSCDWPATA